MKNLFTYGSLMFPVVWQQIVHSEYRSASATVKGFRRICVRDKTHPALVIDRDAAPVTGRVYFDVTDSDIARLDQFETDKYSRVGIVALIDGNPVKADAYLAVNFDELEWRDWDVGLFEQTLLPVFQRDYINHYLKRSDSKR